MSALGAVLAEARVGGTAANIAARLGLDPGLVASMLDQGERLRLLVPAAACGSCVAGARAGARAVATADRPACAGCPLARSR